MQKLFEAFSGTWSITQNLDPSEAMPKGGKVTIRTKALRGSGSEKALSVSIEDTGDGIPVENREQVFVPFFTTKAHGTGIGLPLAKKFVETNGGTISIADGSNGGTRIDVKFPLNGTS